MNNGVRISSSNFIMLYGVTSARMKYRLLVFCMKRWISINNMWAWNNNKKYYYRSSRNMVLHLWQLSDLLISFLESDCWNYSKFSYQVQEHVSLLIQYKLCCISFLMTVLQNFFFQWKTGKKSGKSEEVKSKNITCM